MDLFRSEKLEDSEPRVHPNSPLAVVARPQVVRHTCVSVAALIFLDVLSFQIFQMWTPTCFNMFMPIYTDFRQMIFSSVPFQSVGKPPF